MSNSLAMAYAARRAAGSPKSTVRTEEAAEPAMKDIVAKILARRSKAPVEPTDELTEDDMDLVDDEPVEDPREARRALIASIVAKQRD